MAGDKEKTVTWMKAAYAWYAMAAVALAGNMYFEREAVVTMTEVKTDQSNLTAAFINHQELSAHGQTELRLLRNEMIIDALKDGQEALQQSSVDFMEAVNTNFVAIQTQIKVTQLVGERRDTTKEAQSLERVIERMEQQNQVVPMLYRQNLSDAKDEVIELTAALNRLKIH